MIFVFQQPARVRWPQNGRGVVRWGTDPKTFFDLHGNELIEDMVDFSESQGRNANATGKQKVIWKMLRTTVESYAGLEQVAD